VPCDLPGVLDDIAVMTMRLADNARGNDDGADVSNQFR